MGGRLLMIRLADSMDVVDEATGELLGRLRNEGRRGFWLERPDGSPACSDFWEDYPCGLDFAAERVLGGVLAGGRLGDPDHRCGECRFSDHCESYRDVMSY
jgi:hypothetical protein